MGKHPKKQGVDADSFSTPRPGNRHYITSSYFTGQAVTKSRFNRGLEGTIPFSGWEKYQRNVGPDLKITAIISETKNTIGDLIAGSYHGE